MNKTTLVALVGAAACIGAGAWYATHPAAPAAKPAAAATVVSVVTPLRQDVPVLQQANGTVTPLSTVDLHPQTTSTIAKVHIREGQFVKAGELMFTLDGRAAQAGVDKAQAQLLRDEAALADLERQHRRSLELLAQNFIARGAVDTLASQRDAAQALLAADRAAVRAARVDASYNTIRAPMAGRVGAIAVYPGSLVQLSTSLASITQLDPIHVSFTLPESSLSALLAAQQAGKVPVTASVAGRQVAGALSFIDNSVDPVAGVIRVKAEFDNKQAGLWPGQYVGASLTVQTLTDALVIPQNAIVSNTSGVFVYTVDAERRAQVRPVRVVHGFGLLAAVSGLDGGEQVVVDGKQNLRPGAPVRVAESRANPQAAPPSSPEQAGQGAAR